MNADIHTLATPYALHALPGSDADRFERHLARCQACRSEVDEIRETAARLGAASVVTPPGRVKAAVLDRIAEIRPLPPVAGAQQPWRGSVGGARHRAWRRWWAPVATGLAAAMTAGAIVLGAQLSDARDELDRAQAFGAQMRQLVAAPDMEMIRAEEDGALSTVMVARSLDIVVVIADGMEPVSPDHTYQLWFIDDAGTRPAGLLGHTEQGRLGPFTTHGLGGAGALGITVEPEGGSTQPSREPLMLIDLPTA